MYRTNSFPKYKTSFVKLYRLPTVLIIEKKVSIQNYIANFDFWWQR